MPEFRWILLGLGVLLLAGIWWWGARRSRQAPGDAQLRESTASSIVPPLHPGAAHTDREAAADSADWGVPPFEPLSIRTAEFDEVPHIDLSMTAHSEPFDDTLDLSDARSLWEAKPRSTVATPPPARSAPAATAPAGTAPAGTAPAAPRAAAARAPPPASDRVNGAAAEEPIAEEKQRIVSIRVCALGDSLWPGADLLAVLGDLGLAHGRYQVFHRKHSDGRTLFCAASLVDPGTFDPATMPEQEFRGVTLFAVLPGPADPVHTVDVLIATAEDIAQALEGTVQVSKGVLLSPENAAALREDVARFHASMTG